jgi:hypothetical protein
MVIPKKRARPPSTSTTCCQLQPQRLRGTDEAGDDRFHTHSLFLIDCGGAPILFFAREKMAALNDQNALPAWGELPGERSAARAGADDNYVLGI